MTNGDLLDQAFNGDLGVNAQRIAEKGIKVIELLIGKNLDYGSSVFNSPILLPSLSPTEAILVRMSDNIGRMRNLLDKQLNPNVDESIEDTMKDFAGYAVLYLIALTLEKKGSKECSF